MGKTYKDNPGKWRKHAGWKPKSNKPKPLPPEDRQDWRRPSTPLDK